MCSIRSSAGVMCQSLSNDTSKIDDMGGQFLRASGNAAGFLDHLDSEAMEDLDKAFNIADPTGYVTGRSKKAEDFLENKPMTRAEYSEDLVERAKEAAKQYKELAEYHPAGKPITEEMALQRNIAVFCCVADNVLTAKCPIKDDVPDIKAVRGEVDAMLQNSAFTERLANVKLDRDLDKNIGAICTEELTRKKSVGPALG